MPGRKGADMLGHNGDWLRRVGGSWRRMFDSVANWREVVEKWLMRIKSSRPV